MIFGLLDDGSLISDSTRARIRNARTAIKRSAISVIRSTV